MGRKYQLVVADDEATIRKGMCNYIDWEKMGFSVAADFEDGKETIEYISTHKVDVVFTDIQMAEITGLQVARYIHENQLPVRVVILSGYKEFEYAKDAIRFGVTEYILKPIHMEEIERAFSKIKEELDEQERQQAKQKSRQQDYEDLLPWLQEQFWMNVLLGGLHNKNSIMEKKNLLSIQFNTKTPCGVITVNLQMEEDANQQYYLQKDHRYNLLNNIFSEENCRIDFHPVYLSQEVLKTVVTTREEMELEDFCTLLEQWLVKKKNEVEAVLRLKLEMSMEGAYQDFFELAEHYGSMQMYAEKDESSHRKYSLKPEDQNRLRQKYQLMMDTINDGDFELLNSQMGNLLFEFRNLPLEEVKELLLDIFSMFQQKLMKMSQELWTEAKETIAYSRILEAQNSKELKKICSEFLQILMELVKKRQDDVSKNIIDKVTNYVKQHYQEEISLDLLAEKYYLNSSYLCRLFKRNTGVGLTDYMIELRMEKAKELLLLGKYKIYEVSQMVGYRSDKYFFRVFKQYTGQAPTEFLRSNLE
ncbi:MAG: response regulator [Lachnospiraceae bacterium]|nr:response regulator [Lachnospiraceae bacterium]